MPAVDPGMNGFVTASGYYPDGQAGGNVAYGQAGQYGGMDGYGAGQYGGMDQVDGHPGGYPAQYAMANNYGQQHQQYNYEEYTHYPHPEVCTGLIIINIESLDDQSHNWTNRDIVK